MKKELSWDFEIIKKCSMLYCGVDKSIQESLIPFGFECGEGWKEPLWSLSAKLEALNMQYWPKYHVRIQAVQVKEKFGTLRFYYDIVKDSSWYKRIPYNFFYKLNRKLKHIKYDCKQVQDEAPHVEHKVEELKTKEEYVKEKHYAKNISNVAVEEKDGKWFKHTDLKHNGKWHYEPTKHKLLYKMLGLTQRLAVKFDSYGEKWSDQQSVIGRLMQDEADRLVRIAEDECYDRCETCGHNIGKDGFSKRCETSGWIRYICDDCAKKLDGIYYMDGNAYEKGKCIKTKEQIDAERKEADAKYKANREKYKAEDDAFKKEIEAAREEDIKAGRVSADDFAKDEYD